MAQIVREVNSRSSPPANSPKDELRNFVTQPTHDAPVLELASLLQKHVLVLVTATDGAVRRAMTAHVQRLVSGRRVLGEMSVRLVGASRSDDGEVIEAMVDGLGAALDTRRPAHVTERLVERLKRGQMSLVVSVDKAAARPDGWVAQVLRDLVLAMAPDAAGIPFGPGAPRIVWIAPPCPMLSALALPQVVVGTQISHADVGAWLEALSVSILQTVPEGSELPALEAASRRPELQAAFSLASIDTTRLFPPTMPSISAGNVDEHSPFTWLCRAAAVLPDKLVLSPERSIAQTIELANQAVSCAETLAEDPDTRRDVGRRWSELLEQQEPRLRLALARDASLRALAAGDADEAVRWAKLAVRAGEVGGIDNHENAVLLEVHGRALIAKGDIVTARAVLSRARDRALAAGAHVGLLASIAVETAEAAYLAGDLTSSEAEARRAVYTEGVPNEVRLRGRNVQGKILLAHGKFSEANAHFAADAAEASRVGDPRGELRAQLNRAIALLSAEILDEAEGLFESVLEGGRALGEPRAQALALENLAVIASLRRDYGKALERFRGAISGLKKMGQAAMLAGAAHNLGYLYLRLGDVQQASSMVRYASSLFRRGLAAPLVAEGDDLRARIAARVGRSEEAMSAISHAREILRNAGEVVRVADCDRFEARLALDDGDIRGARGSLDRARGVDESPRGKAEHAILEAEWLRAHGDDTTAVLFGAREALALCRASTDEDLIVEAHLLIAEVARVSADRELLQRHLEGATAARDGMMRSIPESFHAAFLSRPDMIRLAKLERFAENEPVQAATTPAGHAVRPRVLAAASEPRRLLGSDPALRALQSAIRRIAPSETTVLVHGESGTGKELVAEQLHHASDRAAGPLVKVNCAALVETLLLSELFGHEKGAFTGAAARRRGRFELADGGTLFLDEIGDISSRTQVALLRVLQEKTFERVGGSTPIHVDVRVVCATHRDLANMVGRGEFREDLYYRLRGVQLEVPPLRARLSDLGELSEHLLRRVASEHGQPQRRLSQSALDFLALHKWPGNVRELENVLRAVALLTDALTIEPADLIEHVELFRHLEPPQIAPELTFEESSRRSDGPESLGPTSQAIEEESEEEGLGTLPLSEASATGIAYGQIRGGVISLFEMKRMIERDCITRALAETRGNITKAATLLGMKRPRLSQLVKHYGLSAVFTEGS